MSRQNPTSSIAAPAIDRAAISEILARWADRSPREASDVELRTTLTDLTRAGVRPLVAVAGRALLAQLHAEIERRQQRDAATSAATRQRQYSIGQPGSYSAAVAGVSVAGVYRGY